ncbi:MAG: SDR family oxidoreductase [Pirellulaceae bacterium]|nr:SDR family oxidoreductase [Pirellulaceae bacterium]
MAHQTYLVTGGAGFIGSHLVQALVARGAEVRVLDNLSTGKLENLAEFADAIEFHAGDLNDVKLLERVVQGVDCIFHQAALASVPRSVAQPLETNAACVTGTVSLLDQARRHGVRRVVYAASSSCYGDQPFSSKREVDLPAPLSPYAVAKLSGEYYCQAFHATYGLETVCLRYFNVFGPRQDPHSEYSAVIPRFITRLLAGERPVIYGDGLQSRDFTYIDNVVQGNLLAAEARGVGGRSINLASGRSTTLLQLLRALQDLLGTPLEPIHEPPRVGDVRESLADITVARQLLGYEPQVDFDEGLSRSISYYRQLLTVPG